ncbi:germination protein [Thalassobacillus devorans]|uniref:Germination protein n=1 Tax=Thalassobacillus devorans TaxID=279813 RepID=A0ABQ1PKW6_9BACI|nr:Ger(x)C family spore germination protein [Thalassobacillus devorans]NIK30131.1 spore germination protein [Thalassobacillus devorans]GGC98569.1 germination protein [Thalassobacillus devorans]
MKINIALPLLLIVSILLTGCLPHESVEEVALVNLAGVDYVDEEYKKGTVAIHHYGRTKEEIPSEQYLSYTAKSLKEIASGLESKSPRPIRMGKLSFSLYGEELARNDLSDSIDMLARDPHIGRDVYLGIVAGDTQELMEKKYSENETTARYLIGLMEQNEKNNFPTTNLHRFLFAYYGKGMDGFLPYLKSEGDEVKIAGVALFKEALMVDVIPFTDVFTFKMLIENFNQGVQAIEFKDKNVVMENIGSRVKYKLEGNNNKPKFIININITGIVSEISDVGSLEAKTLTPEFEKEFSKYFERNGKKMLAKFQEGKIDPLGLGKILKNRRGNFDKKVWEQQYPTVPIELNIKVNIVESGISA